MRCVNTGASGSAQPNQTVPTGLSALPPPGPATPVTETATSCPRAGERAPRHRRRHGLADGAVCPDQRGRHAQQLDLGRHWNR